MTEQPRPSRNPEPVEPDVEKGEPDVESDERETEDKTWPPKGMETKGPQNYAEQRALLDASLDNVPPYSGDGD